MTLRSLLALLLSGLALSLSATKAEEALSFISDSSTLFDPSQADRTILVTFVDRQINRVGYRGVATYRKRGPYTSSTWSKRIVSEVAQQYGLTELAEWPITELGVHCVVYHIPDSESVDTVINAVSRDKRVELVQQMGVYQMEAREYSDPYYGLQSHMQSMQIQALHQKTTGRNIKIALIDTGVDVEHPDLFGQILVKKNFVAHVSADFSDDLHGTAVAGVIAARTNNGAGIVGIAPDAKLIVLKACWPDRKGSLSAVCNSFTLALAINMAIKKGVNILNMSLTGPQDLLIARLIEKAVEKGIVVVAAGSEETKSGMGFPASLESVVAVRPFFPAKDAVHKHCIEAPGKEILTTQPGGTYDFISGSSIAAAHVSGVIALLAELQPGLLPSQVLKILQDNKGPDIYKILHSEEFASNSQAQSRLLF